MKATTALAMQSLAFGSRLLVPIPPFMSFEATYPSWMVHCPEP